MIAIIITSTVYSRDLRYKESMMMESMMNLPDDMFKQELLYYLTVYDIVKLDNACMNHQYRPQLMDKIIGVILIGDMDTYMTASLFKWLGIRRIYFINMYLDFDENSIFSSSIKNNYVDEFRYIQHLTLRGPIRDDMAIFIISHCPCLLSIDISVLVGCSLSYPLITDHTLRSIAEHCTGLQSLSLRFCWKITDAGLITISEHCPNLKSLEFYNCHQITDASIISISTQCNGLQTLNLVNCDQITDASIISISTQCTGLQSLNLNGCHQITDASIISISENCTGLKRLLVSFTKVTDASLIAIAKNCTGLQYLYTYGCDGLSSDKLHYHFKSVYQLRAVLLSIYPSLPI